jgi:dethiobiotin synthetase
MSTQIVVAGTDTNIGKTVFAAGLTHALAAHYWKPIQSGLEGETDSQCVQRLAGLPDARIIAEAYRLKIPASPHIAAEIDGVAIDLARLAPPRISAPLVIELAGGLAVPITRQHLQIEVVARWKAPVILCAATRLGTINHSLLSIQALKQRAIPILGIAFIGEENADSQRTICAFGGVKDLGRLPHLDPLTPTTLQRAFADAFSVAHLLGRGAAGP